MKASYLLKEANYYRKLGNGNLKKMLLKFMFAKTPVSKLVNRIGYNNIYSKVIKNASKIPPRIFQIENTNFCNARCIMCPHTIMKRKAKTMTQNDFEKICGNVLDYIPISSIIITGFGEPLIDQGIIEKIKWLNNIYNEVEIDIYTNASLLTNEISNELLKLKIHKINFSINGTEKSYKKVMGLDYKRTRDNILYFLNKKKELGLEYPLTNVSLVVVKENENELGKIIEFWKDKADSVMAYGPSDWAGALKGTIINQDPFKNRRWPCPALWTVVTTDVDGNLIMCCRDHESKVTFGNLLKDNIISIRNGTKFKELLKNQLDYKFDTPVCASCDNYFNSTLNWWGTR